MKSAIATLVTIFVVGLVVFWLQSDVLREISYSAYLRANIIYLEAPDFGFVRDPLFWLVLVLSDTLVFGVAGVIGAVVGRSVRGVMTAACLAIALHFTLRYVPRIGVLSWEYNLAALVEATTATVSAFVGARFALRLRHEAQSRTNVPSNSA